MARKIFYSWQATLPNATNRGFILAALEAACAVVGQDLSVDERPEVDRDTQGVPGAPDIAHTIFAKIDAADAFVCDVSIVTSGEGQAKPCPNPNVLIELGYAIKSLGWSRIILVMNTAMGGPELLPFDLKTKRVTTYEMAVENPERAPERKRLQGILKAGLEIISQHSGAPMPGVEIRPVSLVEAACAAVAGGQPSAPAAVRRFMQAFGEGLDELRPTSSPEPPDEDLVRALEATKSSMIEFTTVAEAIAVHDARDAARALFEGLEHVLVGYAVRCGYVGSFRDTDFDLHKFVGHEATVTLFALLLRERRWDLIADLLGSEIFVKGANGDKARRFVDLSSQVKLLKVRKDRLRSNRISLHADLLKERHETGELGKLMPFEELAEADYFLLLRGELEVGDVQRWGVAWAPWSTVFMEHADPPRYLREAERRTSAEPIARALGVPDAVSLRERLIAGKPALKTIFGGTSPFWEGPLQRFDPSAIGSR
jgi:hypothetical protein